MDLSLSLHIAPAGVIAICVIILVALILYAAHRHTTQKASRPNGNSDTPEPVSEQNQSHPV